MPEKLTVLVVGASRGLGLGLAEEWCGRDWNVIATERNPSKGLEALARRYQNLEIEKLDITDAASVRRLRERLAEHRLDILFVNAGIAKAAGATPATAMEADFLDMMLTNALSLVRLVELFEDLVRADGVIAVMTSGLASIANNTGGFSELYSASKAALNMLMKCFASRHPNDTRAILLVAPGWVRTDMGGSNAPLSIEESVPLVVETVARHRGKPGLRFVDRHGNTLPW